MWGLGFVCRMGIYERAFFFVLGRDVGNGRCFGDEYGFGADVLLWSIVRAMFYRRLVWSAWIEVEMVDE